MTAIPDIRYARSADVAIAYQVVGEGPVDLVFVPFFGNIRWSWELPLFVRFAEALSAFSRLILFDKRGTGLSDRPRTLTLETQMDDIRAVLDAVGSERAALLGAIQGSQLCALFAATYPDRTRALALYHPHAAPDDLPPAAVRQGEDIRERWGTREHAEEIARAILPSFADDEAVRSWFADSQRFAASPGSAAEFFRMLGDTDISDVLPTIRVPTLVLFRAGRREAAMRVAALVPGARTVELAGRDSPAWADGEVAAAVARFLSGREELPVPDSVLTTVLFTDIVGSTERAAELGDRAWRDLLERHHASCGASSPASAAGSSTPRATDSSRPSTGRRGRFAAHRQSSLTSVSSASIFVPAFTPASASSTTASLPGSRSASARVWPARPDLGRSSSPAP